MVLAALFSDVCALGFLDKFMYSSWKVARRWCSNFQDLLPIARKFLKLKILIHILILGQNFIFLRYNVCYSRFRLE